MLKFVKGLYDEVISRWTSATSLEGLKGQCPSDQERERLVRTLDRCLPCLAKGEELDGAPCPSCLEVASKGESGAGVLTLVSLLGELHEMRQKIEFGLKDNGSLQGGDGGHSVNDGENGFDLFEYFGVDPDEECADALLDDAMSGRS